MLHTSGNHPDVNCKIIFKNISPYIFAQVTFLSLKESGSYTLYKVHHAWEFRMKFVKTDLHSHGGTLEVKNLYKY